MAVEILLARGCLECPHLSVVDGTSALYAYEESDPYAVTGAITCSHRRVCARVEGELSISDAICRRDGEGGE